MTNTATQVQAFSWRFLLPSYWPTWLAVLLLYTLSWLPYRLQWQLGKVLGVLLGKLAKKRVQIAKRNLTLCFPDWSEERRAQLLKANLHHAGMAILETSMGWWWPEWRIRRHGSVEGFEHVEAIFARGKGVLGIAIHNMNLEMAGRLIGLRHPCVGFYRKHNNPLMEFFQYRGRRRTNKEMIPKQAVGRLMQALNNGELCLYLPDQDYGRKRCEFAPFFAVEQAANTTGTLLFAGQSNCETVFLLPLYTPQGYKLKVLPGLENFPSGDDNQDIRAVNARLEEMILQAPEQYLWMHKRFKTRPNKNDASLYD